MKNRQATMFKTESEILVNSKSTMYAILEHEKYEAKSIPLNSNTLFFKQARLNESFNSKLFTDLKGNVGEEFKSSLRFYYSYTTVSLLLLLFFSVMLYSQNYFTSEHLIVNIISIMLLLLLFYLALYFSLSEKVKLKNLKIMFFIAILLKMLFFIILDKRVFCKLVNESCITLDRIPLSYMIIVEIVLSRIMLFQSFVYLTILGITSFFLFIAIHLYLIADYGAAFLSEMSLIGLMICAQIIECYNREIRMKHMF